MPSDIVVDTNIFVHEHNPEVPRHKEARDFVTALRDSAVQLCVDEGFDLVEAKNRSVIGHEYLKHLQQGMLGFAIVSALASSQRVKIVSRKVTVAMNTAIRRCVPRNTYDCTFVKVALNSSQRTLVSHDFADLPNAVRAELASRIDVIILTAGPARAKL